MLADLNRQLTEAITALEAEAESDGATAVVQRLRAAREAVSLLALERAAPKTPAEPDATPALERRLELEPTAAAARSARTFVRRVLQEWSVPELPMNAAVDVSSELIANAARETRSHLVLSMSLRREHLVVRVWDDGSGRPHLRPYRPGVSERGIGLRLVRHLSQEWGWEDEGSGKWVWARLRVPMAGPTQPEAAALTGPVRE